MPGRLGTRYEPVAGPAIQVYGGRAVKRLAYGYMRVNPTVGWPGAAMLRLPDCGRAAYPDSIAPKGSCRAVHSLRPYPCCPHPARPGLAGRLDATAG